MPAQLSPLQGRDRPPLMNFTEHEELQPLLDTVIPDDSSLPYDMHDVVLHPFR